ncbi:kap113 [Symbiodinium natans]|uniref:Kap113 protein n=1 Tax=Symbiodinium natans TaxID=878477 RepID=A0A812JD09_9DINO|nr:kap113 [Symbiodinium natans]
MAAVSPVGQVVQLLLAAASSDARARQPAHERLQDLENRLGAGLVPLLLEAYADASVDAQGRYLAILMCKNVVDRQWQLRGSGKVISAEEKNAIKEQLLRLVKAATSGGLPHLLELTMVLRRVCRFEFPMNWDGLAHLLLAELQGLRERGFSEAALAVVLVLHQVLKEQSSKRLLSSRREFHQLGGLLVEPLGAVWALKMEHMRHLKNQGLGPQVSPFVYKKLLMLYTWQFWVKP